MHVVANSGEAMFKGGMKPFHQAIRLQEIHGRFIVLNSQSVEE